MTLWLNPEVRSGLGEDTFWQWAERELGGRYFEDSPMIAERIAAQKSGNVPQFDDVLLQYATLGGPAHIGRSAPQPTTVALLWELYHEMHAQLPGHPTRQSWERPMALMEQCAAFCDVQVVSTKFADEFFGEYGESVLLPIPVSTELFKPATGERRKQLREKHGMPDGQKVGVWCGTRHRMKGLDIAQAAESAGAFPGPVRYVYKEQHIPQEQLAELMSCADFAVFSGRLRPFFMFEWEAFACDLEVFDVSPHAGVREHPVDGGRQMVMDLGWDREEGGLKQWQRFLSVL